MNKVGGFSFVECLISLSLSLFVLAGIYNITANQFYRYSVRQQESNLFAEQNYIKWLFRSKLRHLIDITWSENADEVAYIEIFQAVGTSWAPMLPNSLNNRVIEGTDVIVIAEMEFVADETAEGDEEKMKLNESNCKHEQMCTKHGQLRNWAYYVGYSSIEDVVNMRKVPALFQIDLLDSADKDFGKHQEIVRGLSTLKVRYDLNNQLLFMQWNLQPVDLAGAQQKNNNEVASITHFLSKNKLRSKDVQ